MNIKSKLTAIVLITVAPLGAASAYFVVRSAASLEALDSADRAIRSLHALAMLRLFTNRLAAAVPGSESSGYHASAQSALLAWKAARDESPPAGGGAGDVAGLYSSLAAMLEAGRIRGGAAGSAAAVSDGEISAAIEKFAGETSRTMLAEKTRVEKAYALLQTSLGAFPWMPPRARDRLSFARDSISYFLAAEQSCSGIARQAREARAIASSRSSSRTEFDRLGFQASRFLEEWKSAIYVQSQAKAEGEPKDLQNALDVEKKYREMLGGMSRAVESALAGDRGTAAAAIDSRVSPVVDGYILPKISKAFDEYRKDVYDCHGEVRTLMVRSMVQGVAALAAISLFAAFFAFTLMRGLVKSVKALEAGSRAVGSGDLGHRIEIRSADELGRLAQAFNRMAEDLEKITVSRDYLRSLASEITLAGERERRDIAAVLHDDLGQKLALLRIKLGMLRSSPEGQSDEMQSAMEVLEGAIAQTRSLTTELSPPVLYELGYAAALEWIGEKTGRENGLSVECDTSGAGPEPSMDVKVLLFQSVREALRNVVKHASARRVSIAAAGKDGRIVTTVEDDGAGFDPSAAERESSSGGHWGLFSIRERLGRIGGSLGIESSPGRGTRITMDAPL